MNQNYQLDSTTVMAKLIPQLIKAKNVLTQDDWDKLIDSLKYSWGCNKCGKLFHFTKKCPASGRKCNYCGRMGHFAAVCLYKMTKVRTRQYRKTQNYKLSIPVGSSVLVRERSSKQWVIEGSVVQHSGDKYRIQQADGTFILAYPWFVKDTGNGSDEFGYFEMPVDGHDLAANEIGTLNVNQRHTIAAGESVKVVNSDSAISTGEHDLGVYENQLNDAERLEPLSSIEEQNLANDEGNEAELLDPTVSNGGLADGGNELNELEPENVIEDNDAADDVELLINSTEEQDNTDNQHELDDGIFEPTEEQEPTENEDGQNGDETVEPASSDEGFADNGNETNNNGNEGDDVEILELDTSNEEQDSTNNGNEFIDAEVLKPDTPTEGQILSDNEPKAKDVEPLKPSSNEAQTPATVSDVEPPKPASNEGPVAQNTEVKKLEPLNPVASNDGQTAANSEVKTAEAEPLNPATEPPKTTQVTPPESSKDGQTTVNNEVKASDAEPLKPATSTEGKVLSENKVNDVELKQPTTLIDGQVVVEK